VEGAVQWQCSAVDGSGEGELWEEEEERWKKGVDSNDRNAKARIKREYEAVLYCYTVNFRQLLSINDYAKVEGSLTH